MSFSIVKVVLEGESSWIDEEREKSGLTPLDLMTLKAESEKMTVMTVMNIYYILTDKPVEI